MGDSDRILSGAVNALASLLMEMRESSRYITVAQDYVNQPDFLNMAVCGWFEGSPRELLLEIGKIESAYGRNRANEIPKGPRFLDIDIELFGTMEINEPDLVIPHPRIRFRRFVLVPVLELLPECVDPITGTSYQDICAAISDQGVKKVGVPHGNGNNNGR